MTDHAPPAARMPAMRVAMLSALLLGAVFATASSCTSTSSKCINQDCTITFNNGARSTTVDALNDAEVTVVSVSGDRVRITIAGEGFELVQGQPVPVGGGFDVTATEVSSDKVVIKTSS